jgi:hypothetical protein
MSKNQGRISAITKPTLYEFLLRKLNGKKEAENFIKYCGILNNNFKPIFGPEICK